MKLEAITRPNGSVYRPRKLAIQTLGNEDETNGVVVFGTHDVATARAAAVEKIADMAAEYYGSDEAMEVTGEGRLVWWRRDLAHFDEGQAWYHFADDEKAGRAGVRFDVVERI